jgi:uncharacterized protein YjiS (DUF1127 family)
MAVDQCDYQCLNRPVNGFWQQLAHLLRRVGIRLERWEQLYAQRRHLREMDDRLLKDIGLSRADVKRIAARPFWDDPAQRGELLDERYRRNDNRL